MVRVLIASLVAAICLFVWQMAAWQFTDVHKLDLDPKLANEADVTKALEGTERGFYTIPGWTQGMDPESDEAKAVEEAYAKGPRAFIVFDPEGAEMMSAKTLGISGGVNFVICLVIALMLQGARVRSFFGRFLMCVGLGIIIVLMMDVQQWNWWNFPDDFTKGFAIDHLAGMGIVGVVMAVVLRPGRSESPPFE